jgi:cytochrome c-type biogenesis protein CcsB
MSGGMFLLLTLLGASVAYTTHAATGRRAWGQGATLLTAIAWATLTIGLLTRGVRAGHWPLTTRFEFALATAWAALAFYLCLERSMETRAGGAFVLPLVGLLTLWAAHCSPAEQAIRPLAPVLRSGWFPLHVGCTAVAYGAFIVAGGLGLMFWASELRARLTGEAPEALHRRSETTAPWALADYYIWRAAGLGFPWLTLGMLTGAVWAQVAWGRYWAWDPKESWTLITWLIWLILLHGRALRGWRGRRVARLAVLGLGAVWFTFLGVGWLVQTLRLESVHTF